LSLWIEVFKFSYQSNVIIVNLEANYE